MSGRCCCGARLPSAAGRTFSITTRSKEHIRSFKSSVTTCAEAPAEATNAPSRARRRSSSASPQGVIDDGATKLRRQMFTWLHGPGRKLRQPLNGSTNYLGAYNARGDLIRRRDAQSKERGAVTPRDDIVEEEDPLVELDQEAGRSQKDISREDEDKLPPETVEDLRPYPLNRHFRSQPVLSEAFREEIWRRLTQGGQDIRLISSGMGVSLERVAAVVRMKEIEKRWQQEGKPLATPYSKAVLAMLPTTPFDPAKKLVGHESINDLPVTPQTKAQLFHPVSESRAFTRTDAGKAFDEELLPADERIPHPELVLTEKDRLSGMRVDEQAERAAERWAKQEGDRKKMLDRRRQKQERERRVVAGGRWDFMFREMNAEAVGKDGRSPTAVGWRYGVPHQDRKKGQVKIPTHVL